MWLENPVTVKTEASEREARVIREVLSLEKEEPKQQPNVFHELLKHFDPQRILRIQAWIKRLPPTEYARDLLPCKRLKNVKKFG